MSGVEALEQTTTETTPQAEVQTIDTSPSVTGQTSTLDADLEGIWDRANVTNGADRGANGKFVSTDPSRQAAQIPDAVDPNATDTPSLEGETGEGLDGSTPVDVPLPPNWAGKEAVWNAIPVEHRAAVAQHQQELHSRLSDMGRQVSTFKPLSEAASEFAEYFNGNLRGSDGQLINPADGIRYLANIQRAMDSDPFNTLLSIADTYNLREQLAQAFGGQVQSVPADQKQLLNEIAGLKQTVARLQDPAVFEEVLNGRELKSEISRFAESKPLYAQVEADLPFFITKAKTQLGEGAGRMPILEKAYELAVQADPALRAQTQAAPVAANNGNAAKAEAARRATGVNVTSTSTGKAKQPSLDDELGAVWEKHRRA